MLTEVNFYLFEDLSKNLGKLLESIIQNNNRAIVLCSNPEDIVDIDNQLWTYSQLSFLPHGTIDDVMPEHQPILLTTSTTDKAINGATTLVCIDIIPDILEVMLYDKLLVICHKIQIQSLYDDNHNTKNKINIKFMKNDDNIRFKAIDKSSIQIFLVQRMQDGKWQKNSVNEISS